MSADPPIILVVEDEFLIRLDALHLLKAAGFVTIEATNADEAIEILESRDDIQVVLTDIEMPGSMDGLRLAHAVRKKWPPVKLVLVSGKASVGLAQPPIGALFFAKPYDMDEVTAGIHKLMAA